MIYDKRKIVIIGCGFVGMSYAYCLVNQTVCDELILIDIDEKKACGEAMDLNHSIAFAPGHMKIRAGGYADCKDADIVVITAGLNQKKNETRLDLLSKNAKIFEDITLKVLESKFNGIFLIATNPVDIMTYIVKKKSGFPISKVIGSGTTLDTARLRFNLSEYFGINTGNIHAYVIGEHGDSEFVPWSHALIGTKKIEDICIEYGKKYSYDDVINIGENVKNAAYSIIEAKNATYYGIGMALTRITKAIFSDEHSILTVSTYLNGEYGRKDLCIGVPCVIGRKGIISQIYLNLNENEKVLFNFCFFTVCI